MTRFVFCHHAERADKRPAWEESDKYPGITKEGEKDTRKKTKALAKMICDSPVDSVVILGGCSKAIRTKSTLMVFTDELRQIFQNEKGILFSKPFSQVSPLDALKEMATCVGSGAKIIVDFPFPMEEFIAFLGQKESAVARRMIAGLNGQAGFFRRFFPNSHLVLVNNSHAPETDMFINHLQKRSCGALANIVSFM
jgi:hypothetical protein